MANTITDLKTILAWHLHYKIHVQILSGSVDDEILTIICDDSMIDHHDEDLVKGTYSYRPGSLTALATV
jgi:hypothetical protein